MSATAPTDYPSPDEREEQPANALETEELIQMCRNYFDEAQEAREGGTNPRDLVWDLNWDAYWGRYDTTYKADWQARETMPEVANFVDRWAAGMRAPVSSGEDWHSVDDANDDTGLMGQMMTKFNNALLARSGRNASGQPVGFDAAFADCVKCGALSASALAVTVQDGKVRVDAVDPRELFYDPKARGLYRVRRYEVDRYQLEALAEGGLYDEDAIEQLQTDINQEAETERQTSSGGLEVTSRRRVTVVLKEFLCTILDRDGKMIAENQLIVMANDKFIIRGPEENPFWHKKDWIAFMPPIQVPFSRYGRSYVESFRQLAGTFTELTNLLIDAAFASSISSHMVWLAALDDPSQIQNGIAPGIVVTADEDWPPGQPFVQTIETGKFSPAIVTVWQGIKAELREGAFTNETSLGQIPPKGDITATEINASTAGSGALNQSLATDYDTRLLAVVLELVFWTGLQIFDPEKDPEIVNDLGEEMTAMLLNQRESIRERTFTFTSFGITSAVNRGQRLQKLLAFLQTIASNEILAAAFAQDHSIPKLIEELLRNFDVDTSRLKKSEEEKQLEQQQQLQQLAQAALGGELPEGPSSGGSPPRIPGGEI